MQFLLSHSSLWERSRESLAISRWTYLLVNYKLGPNISNLLLAPFFKDLLRCCNLRKRRSTDNWKIWPYGSLPVQMHSIKQKKNLGVWSKNSQSGSGDFPECWPWSPKMSRQWSDTPEAALCKIASGKNPSQSLLQKALSSLTRIGLKLSPYQVYFCLNKGISLSSESSKNSQNRPIIALLLRLLMFLFATWYQI